MLAIGFWTGYFAGILTIPILLFVMFLFYILVIIVEHKKNMLKMVEREVESTAKKIENENKKSDYV